MTEHHATPRQLGYRMPAEWEPHAATWLSWPHNKDSWPGQFEPVPGIWQTLVQVLSAYEPVHILAGAGDVWAEATRLVGSLPRVRLFPIATNDAWTRDHGPTFLCGPRGLPPALVHWNYNAWGNKYPPFDCDERVPEQLSGRLGMRRFRPGIVMEGGAIEVNGHGTLMTTEQCLLNPNRNPDCSRAQIEQVLQDHLGVHHFIWLGEGIAGDDTDGHIDELARFVNPNVVVAPRESDPQEVNHAPLEDNWRRLQLAQDEQGKSLELVALPMPRPIYFAGQRLPACYTNFYIANGCVLVPQFDDPADRSALEILRPLFPGRQVIGLKARELALGLGAYHCITQQQPLCSGA